MKQQVEREIPVPKPYTQTLEVVKQARFAIGGASAAERERANALTCRGLGADQRIWCSSEAVNGGTADNTGFIALGGTRRGACAKCQQDIRTTCRAQHGPICFLMA